MPVRRNVPVRAVRRCDTSLSSSFRGYWRLSVKYHTLLLLLVSTGLFAQTNTGSISGTVHDQQSAVMEGVKLTVTNLATNVKQTATSSNAGVYSLPALE